MSSELVQALESYSSHLEPSFVKLRLPPTSADSHISPAFDLSTGYVNALDNEFTRVYDEYTKRLDTVKTLGEDMITLWAEMGTPQEQTDTTVVKYSRESPEQLGLHEHDIERLTARRDKLAEEKKIRERKVKELRTIIEGLWSRLSIREQERKAFNARTRGCGLRTINDLEDELARLNELKRQNLGLFVEETRCKLQELWDTLYFSEDEMLEFTPAFSGEFDSGPNSETANVRSDVYSDALLSAHEAEIARLEALKDQRLPLLQCIEKHRSLIKDRDELAASSQDASRLLAKGQKGEKRDPTRLLREEKMRKRISRELPKVEIEVRSKLEAYEEEYGRPFLVHGESYLDEMATSQQSALPPRSRTPAAPIVSENKLLKPTPSTQPRSVGPGGSIRGPPPRSKTPNLNTTINRNPCTSLVPTSNAAFGRSTTTSPFKSSSRLPLSNLDQGNNSPGRRQQQLHPETDKPGGIPRLGSPGPGRSALSPPKLKDFFSNPAIATPLPRNDWEEDSQRSNSVVRHMTPEDVYDDNAVARKYMNSSLPRRSPQPQATNTSRLYRPDLQRNPNSYLSNVSYLSSTTVNLPPPGPSTSRQISETSNSSRQTIKTITSGGSGDGGSENWETYSASSDGADEDDTATRNDYARRMRMAAVNGPGGVRGVDMAVGPFHSRKRGSLETQQQGLTKRAKPEPAIYGNSGIDGQLVRVQENCRQWTKETY